MPDSISGGSDPREAMVKADPTLIAALARAIGPRPPTSGREHVAAEVIAAELEDLGHSAKVEAFDSQRSFGLTYLAIFGLALLSWPLSRSPGRSGRLSGAFLGAAAGALGLAEARFALWSPLNLLRTRKSFNVWTAIEPSGRAERDRGVGTRQTICLVSHMDSSRSGLMFHPAVTPHLGKLVGAAGLATVVNAVSPLLARFAPARVPVRVARLLLVFSTAMILERELMGEDVPGANDNASGVAACLNLAAHFTEQPLERSRLVILVTGSEESGVIGMRDFLRNYDTEGWLFVNFDGVSADAPLRVLSRENGPGGPDADPALLAAAAKVGQADPELEARPLRDGSGLPYDATAVSARGGRAISIVNQEGAIPDYHWPTDTVDRVSEEAFSRAVRFGAALVRELDART